MKKAYAKDVLRSILNGKKRFLSIMVITILGVGMFSALKAACNDLYYSADQFFDSQKLYDIRVLSTLGLTEADLTALGGLEGVQKAEGGYSETVYILEEGQRRSVEMRTLTENVNIPFLLEGRLPEKPNEIAVTESVCKSHGKTIGDTVVLEEEPENLNYRAYRISGIVIDSMDINSTEGAMGFRAATTTDYVFFLNPQAVDSEVYTVAYLQLEKTEGLNCYFPEYKTKVDAVIGKIESQIKEQREQLRYEEIVGEAMEEWQEGKQEMEEEFAKAETEINDAKEELEDGRQELLDGERELREQEQTAKDEFAKARQEIEDGFVELAKGEEELATAHKQLLSGLYHLNLGKDEFARKSKEAGEKFALAEAEFAKQEAILAEGWKQFAPWYEAALLKAEPELLKIENALSSYNPSNEDNSFESRLKSIGKYFEEQSLNNGGVIPDALKDLQSGYLQIQSSMEPILLQKNQLTGGQAAFDTAKADYLAQKAEAEKQLAQANFTLTQAEKELDEGFAQYEAGVAELEENRKKLTDGLAELETEEADANQKIADAKQELAEGRQELADGEQELEENIQKYEEEKADAEQELADARQEIEDIDMTRWYVQDRESLSGYSNIKNDAASIEAVGKAFPILFLTVAILISLTTITRMVEEERGLIGAYKALGFSNHEIRQKYLLYAAMACLLGGIMGNILAFVGLPAIIFVIFRTMYLLPEFTLCFDWLSAVRGLLAFEIAILTATWFACEKELLQMPAILMRPKSPKAGSRVFLERIPSYGNGFPSSTR